MAIETSRGSASALASIAPAPDDDSLQAQDDAPEDEDEPEAEHDDESPGTIKKRLLDWIENPNIAREIDQTVLDTLGALVVDEYTIDEMSRAEWKDKAQKALDFTNQKTTPKQYPWADASNVIYPLITSAALRFGAVAYPALVPNRSVVKGVVWGDDKGTPATVNGKPDGAPKLDPVSGQPVWIVPPGAKAKRADKIGEHMSWQLLEEMEYWEDQTDAMLHQIPVVGGAIRKSYRDTIESCNASEIVDIMNLVWSMSAKSFEKAPRKTEIQTLYPHEVQELELADETFLPLVYGPGDVAPAPGADPNKPPPDPNDTSAPRTYLEQHRRYDLDGDGYDEPITVTVHQRSGKVVRIIARYDEDGIETKKDGVLKRIRPTEAYTLYRFLPNPEGGSYPCGFGHFLKPLNEAINTTLNQMFDAGHLQIAGGGFIGTGLSLHAGNTNFSIGEYKPVNSKGGSVRDNIFPIPWPGPNVVLFQMLGFLVGAGKEVASIQDALTGDASLANTPPTTMLALVDQGMKVYTAIYKRLYRGVKSELKKLYRLNRLHLIEDERYQVGDTWRTVTPEDYRLGGGVEPVADPTMVSDMQRITRAALIVDRAKNNPLVNQLAAERYLFEAASIPRISDFLPDKMPPPQESPEQIKAQAAKDKVALDGQIHQFEVAEAQSKLGLTRAQELEAYTQAMVNFAKAKSTLTEPQVQWMETQLTAMRLHIEALNTTVKAAEVDAKNRGHDLKHRSDMTGHVVRHAGNLADTAQKAREVANEQPDAEAGSADGGGGGGSPAAIPEPGGAGPDGSGVSSVAPSPGDSMLPAIPGPTQPGS